MLKLKLIVGRICVAGTFLLTLSCSFDTESLSTDPADVLSGTDEQIFVGDTIEMNYDPNVIMKRAESYFEKESYPEAIVEYKHFLDLHRKHILAPYAQYKIAMSHFKTFKTIDRDLAPIKRSLKAFNDLLTDFPGNQYEGKTREKIRECRTYLAQHHLFVGRFYFRKESYLAAAYRYENVIKTYPELDESGEAMYQLARTYNNLGADEWSRDWLIAFLGRYPEHEDRKKGQNLLAELQKENPDLVVAQSDLPSEPVSDGDTNRVYDSGAIGRNVWTFAPAFQRVSTSANNLPNPNGYANAQVNGSANGHTNAQVNGSANGHTNAQVNGATNAHANAQVNGSANGHTNAQVNGATNGHANAQVNGSANGHTNAQVNGSANGHTNAQVNGATNAHANAQVNGSANGHTNAQVNGATNGHANAQVNGSANGHTNGQVNGATNGHANAQVNGATNGHTNGQVNGATNGQANGQVIDQANVSSSSVEPQNCSVGSWCKSSLPSPIPTHNGTVPSSPPTKVCQPGQWC